MLVQHHACAQLTSENKKMPNHYTSLVQTASYEIDYIAKIKEGDEIRCEGIKFSKTIHFRGVRQARNDSFFKALFYVFHNLAVPSFLHLYLTR